MYHIVRNIFIFTPSLLLNFHVVILTFTTSMMNELHNENKVIVQTMTFAAFLDLLDGLFLLSMLSYHKFLAIKLYKHS